MYRKHQKTQGFWVYVIMTPDKMYYAGMSNQQPKNRHRQSQYKGIELEPYIEKYGWDSMEISILQDNMTEEQALYWEGRLIDFYCSIGRCINKRRSGGWTKDKEKVSKYHKQYDKEHREQRRQYNKKHREERKQYDAKRRSTPEGKIYNRVKNYNHNHTPIETPMEAKQKYLESGYIPDYIKNDDLN